MVLGTYLSGYTSNRRTNLELLPGRSLEVAADTCIALELRISYRSPVVPKADKIPG